MEKQHSAQRYPAISDHLTETLIQFPLEKILTFRLISENSDKKFECFDHVLTYVNGVRVYSKKVCSRGA